jgi:hypothetical protein
MIKVVEMTLRVYEWDYTVMHRDDDNNSSVTTKNHVPQTPKCGRPTICAVFYVVLNSFLFLTVYQRMDMIHSNVLEKVFIIWHHTSLV